MTGYTTLKSLQSYSPPASLQQFLEGGNPPIYVGFGSIVIENSTSIIQTILQVQASLKMRMIIAIGWSDMVVDAQMTDNAHEIFVLREDCPHDWLFPKMACVVHHGGAGTTAAGLRAGKPTVVIPFFGDQFFWGDMIARSGAGPPPIPHQQLTSEGLSQAIFFALKEGIIKARLLSEQIQNEDGNHNAMNHFHACLPSHGLNCELANDRVACWKLKSRGMRLSALAATVLRKHDLIDWNDIEMCKTLEHDIAAGPYDPLSGAAWAITDLLLEGFRGMGEIIAEVPHIPVVCSRLVQKSYSQLQGKENIAKKPEKLGEVERKSKTDKSSDGKILGEYMVTGMLRVSKATARAPGAFTSAMAQGSHNLPRLWGDTTVRSMERTTGIRSGMANGCKELFFGVFDGTVGLFSQPINGLLKDGLPGMAKGAVKGLLGFPVKYFAGKPFCSFQRYI